MISDQVKVYYFNNNKVRVPKTRYFAEITNSDLELNDKMQNDLDIKLIEKENEIDTIENLLNEMDLEKKEKTINLVFNGSELEIPADNQIIKCNDKKVDKDFEIKDGDRIKIQKKGMTVNRLFKYINYNISDSLKENMELVINGERGKYNDIVNSGDNIKMKLKKRQKEEI